MQRTVQIGLVAAIMLIATGCGVAVKTAPTLKSGVVSAQSKQAKVIGLKQAFALATAHAKQTYGDDFRPVMAFADKAFDPTGTAVPTTWRFNLVGHLRGQADYSLVKVQIQPDGTPFVDPKKGGPFLDRNNDHGLPQLDLANVVDPEAGWGLVLADGFGKKFPPTTAISWEVRPSDRLKQTVMVFKWSAVRAGEGGMRWYCDTSINPMTGEIVETDATHD